MLGLIVLVIAAGIVISIPAIKLYRRIRYY